MDKPAVREGGQIPVATFEESRWRMPLTRRSAMRYPGTARYIHLPGAVVAMPQQNLSAVLNAVLQKLAA